MTLPGDVEYNEFDLRDAPAEIRQLWVRYTDAIEQTSAALILLNRTRKKEREAWIDLADAIAHIEKTR